MRLVLATRNEHKLRELGRMLDGVDARAAARRGRRCRPRTATRSPRTRSARRARPPRRSGAPAIADDSGIEADALGGAPGIFSARFAGPDATDAENLAKLRAQAPAGSGAALRLRHGLRRAGRRGADVRRASARGTLAADARGSGGFGYDPAFLPDDVADGRTMAELSDAEKDAISHRGRAARALLALAATRRLRAVTRPRRPSSAAAAAPAPSDVPTDLAAARARRRSALFSVAAAIVPRRAQARHRPRHRLARVPRRGGALGDRPRRRAADAVRGPRRAAAARPGAPLRPRQGRAPRRARRERRAAARRARDRLRVRPPARHAAAARGSRRRGGRSLVLADRDRDRHRRAWSRASRSARRYGSPALAANAVHFGSDLAGSLAVLAGTILVATGHPAADALAGLLVALLVIGLALRLLWQSVQVLMDRTSTDAEQRIRAALAGLREPLELRRVRVRHAAGRHFADLVVGVAPDKGVGQAHATADAVEDLVARRARQRRRRRPRRAGRARGRPARAGDRGGGGRAGGARGPQRARDARRATTTSSRCT